MIPDRSSLVVGRKAVPGSCRLTQLREHRHKQVEVDQAGRVPLGRSYECRDRMSLLFDIPQLQIQPRYTVSFLFLMRFIYFGKSLSATLLVGKVPCSSACQLTRFCQGSMQHVGNREIHFSPLLTVPLLQQSLSDDAQLPECCPFSHFTSALAFLRMCSGQQRAVSTSWKSTSGMTLLRLR